MQILPTELAGCFLIVPEIRRDERGCFVKTYHDDLFRAHGLATDFREEYFSSSHQGVLRGLHFQTPPHAHAKLVYCVRGSVLDAAVDLRIGSPTYGRHLRQELNEDNACMLYLPAGVAHGFLALSEQALMMYKVTSTYAPASDGGIRWDSAGIDWPASQPRLSARDRELPALAEFSSPFVYPGAAP